MNLERGLILWRPIIGKNEEAKTKGKKGGMKIEEKSFVSLPSHLQTFFKDRYICRAIESLFWKKLSSDCWRNLNIVLLF